jgi:hypothetical protein
MSKEHVISIKDGVAEFVFDDDLIPLTKEGETTIKRVSHVEPHPSKPGWLADMRPIGGPVLGNYGTWDESMWLKTVHMLDPFETRAAALDAERDWLRKEKGL